jgi:hypothetical protein
VAVVVAVVALIMSIPVQMEAMEAHSVAVEEVAARDLVLVVRQALAVKVLL